MKKRLYLIFSVCCLTFLSFTACTTSDDNNSGTTDTDVIGDDTIEDDLDDGINDIGDDLEDGINDVEDGLEDAVDDVDDALDMDDNNGTTTP
ncbi:MAG: hypothetical protein ACK5JH_04870 [Anaerocolumna sp.]